MKRTFVELPSFKSFIDKHGDKNLLKAIQDEILTNPSRGNIISGTGGVRKDRIQDTSRGKGKRGGFRYLFLDLPDREKTYLVVIYGKGVKIDISPDEKKVIKELVYILKKGAK